MRVARAGLHVDLLGWVGAFPLHRAIEAPLARSLGLLIRLEVEQAPKGLDLGTLHVLAHPEGHEVNVMAALGYEWEGACGNVAPVAADEAVGKVPVEDVLDVVDVHDLAQDPAVNDLFDFHARWEVPSKKTINSESNV